MASDKLVIGVVGMPGSGKGIIDEVAEGLGCTIVIMGDVIRAEARNMGLEPTPEVTAKIMLEIRAKEGLNAVAKRCVPKIGSSSSRCVVIDGIRSVEEIREFKRNFPSFILIAVQSSPQTRFERLYQRKRSDDPEGWKAFLERDRRELKVGLRKAMKTADYTIINDGSIAEFKENIVKVLKKVLSVE